MAGPRRGRRPAGPIPEEQLRRGWRGRPSMLKVLSRGSLTHPRFPGCGLFVICTGCHSAGAISHGKISSQVGRTNRSKSNSCSGEASERRTSDPGAPDAPRGRGAGRGRQGQPPRSPGRDYDPVGLPAQAACRRGLRPALGPGRLQWRRPTRTAGQERHTQHPPPSPFVFVSERGSPFTTAGFARMVERAAAAGGLELKVHPHMLRHACGYALATRATTPEQFRDGSAIDRSPARQSIQPWRQTGSRISGGTDLVRRGPGDQSPSAAMIRRAAISSGCSRAAFGPTVSSTPAFPP
jgi:hypothetical protein